MRTSERRFKLLKRLVYDLSPVDVDKIEAQLANNGAGSISLRSAHQSKTQEYERPLKEIALLLLDEDHLKNFGLEFYNDNICQKSLHRVFLNKSYVATLKEIINESSVHQRLTKPLSIIDSVKK